ncbi:MAG: phospho-N-acetylmuramoyl-pentapeptide-transferase [Bacillota bacterium]
MIHYLLAILIAFFGGMILAPIIIGLIKRLNVKQTILSYVSQHEDKQGIPTMGGGIFIIPAIVATFVLGGSDYVFAVFAVLLTMSYAVIGFLDDFLKVVFKRNMGLKGYQKIISQVMIALIASYFAYRNNFVGTSINLPMFNTELNLGWWYIPFSMFVYVALTNSVNLTDGLDGLSATTSSVYFAIFFVVIFLQMGVENDLGRTIYAKELHGLLIFIASVLGGLGAFLWFNTFKAKIIMGDTGAMALGGAAAMVALISKNPLLILLTGIMFVVSSISVIIQVIVFKLKKKRVWLMSLFHHHLELKGHSEAKIVSYYAIITFIGGVVSLIVM